MREAYQRVEEEQSVSLAPAGSEVSANKQVLVLERLQLPFVSAPPLDLASTADARGVDRPNGCGKSTLLKTILGRLAALPPLSLSAVDRLPRSKPCRSSTPGSPSVMEHLGLQDSLLAEGSVAHPVGAEAGSQRGSHRAAPGSLSGGERPQGGVGLRGGAAAPAQLPLLDGASVTNHLGSGVVVGDRNRAGGFPGAMMVAAARRRLPAGAVAPTHRLQTTTGGWMAASGLVRQVGGALT